MSRPSTFLRERTYYEKCREGPGMLFAGRFKFS
jgi:hypothetical protein